MSPMIDVVDGGRWPAEPLSLIHTSCCLPSLPLTEIMRRLDRVQKSVQVEFDVML